MQHALSRHELRRNPAAYRGRLVDHAEDLVPRLQAARCVVDNDVVEHVPAAAVEGAHVVTGDESQAGVLGCWDCQGLAFPPSERSLTWAPQDPHPAPVPAHGLI